MPKTIATDIKNLMETFKNAYEIEGWRDKPNLFDHQPDISKISVRIKVCDGIIFIQSSDKNDFSVICYYEFHSNKWEYSHKFTGMTYQEAKKTLLHICDIIFDAAPFGDESYEVILNTLKSTY